MTALVAAALGYAANGWPVLPARPNDPACRGGDCSCKAPLTRHGLLDASTDRRVIHRWWDRWPDANVAVATGSPGPDVLDIDVRPGGAGWAAYHRLRRAVLLAGALAVVRTPSLGQHWYFPGSGQRGGGLHAARLDFKASGGYVIAPPSVVHGRAYVLLRREPSTGERLDWTAVRALLAPPRMAAGPSRPLRGGTGALAAWVAGLEEGNRNNGLFWAACRAAEEGTDTGPLVAAAVKAGLDEHKARATVASAERSVR
jgi:hypothetical protein